MRIRYFISFLIIATTCRYAACAQDNNQSAIFVPPVPVAGPTPPLKDDDENRYITAPDKVVKQQPKTPESNPGKIPVVERSDDELVLVDLRLGRVTIAQAVSGYFRKNSLMLPLSQITQALQFPIKVEPQDGRASGWFLNENKNFTLDLARREAVVNGKRSNFTPGLVEAHKDDIYVDTALLAQWFPINLNFSFATQTVSISSQEGVILPAELEAERKNAEARLAGRQGNKGVQGPFQRLDTPYSLYTVPYVDITSTSGYEKQPGGKPFRTQASALANSDFLYMHSSIYAAADNQQNLSDLRWTLSRRDPDGKIFQPDEWMGQTKVSDALNTLKVSDLEFGDISTQQLPLTALSQQGRGAYISNMPLDRSTRHDRTTLQGDLQPGWDVELYRNDELLLFQHASTNGRYEFMDVPLLSGLNIIRLVFYGPFGQTREETKRFLVTSNLTEQGKSYFSFSASQQNTNAFDIRNQNLSASVLDGSSPFENQVIRGKPRTEFEYEYGLTNNVSLFANASALTTPDNIARNYVTGGAATTVAGVYGRADVAHDNTGNGNAYMFSLQDNVFGISLSADDQIFKHFISEFTETVTDPVTNRITARADAPVKLPYVPRLNIGFSGARVTYLSDRVVDEYSNRISTSIGRLSLSHQLIYRTDTSPQPLQITSPISGPLSVFPLTPNIQTVTPLNKQTTGELIANLPIGNKLMMRGDMFYGINPTPGIQMLSLANEYIFSKDTNATFEVGRELTDQSLTTYITQINHKFEHYTVGTSASYDSRRNAAIGLTLSTSFGENPRTKSLEFYPDPTAQNGIISARAYNDTNGNGVYDNGDKPIENAKFLVNGGSGKDVTDKEGDVLIRNVQPDTRTSLSLDNNSLESPYMMSNRPGVDVVTRPGVPVIVDFPVGGSGDIEGTVRIADKDGTRKEAANVDVQVVSKDSRVVKEVKSSFDGYYLLDAIPTGTYSLRVSPEQAKRLGFNMESLVYVTIKNNEDSSHVVDLTIRR